MTTDQWNWPHPAFRWMDSPYEVRIPRMTKEEAREVLSHCDPDAVAKIRSDAANEHLQRVVAEATVKL